MKQALLITVYRDEANLIRLLRHFSDGDAAMHFRIFVHVDKKSREIDVDRILNLTMVPEEVFFATAIAGTEYESKPSVPYLRYANWDQSRGAVPAVLDERDFLEIRSGEYAFARKIDTEKSAKLLRLIGVELLGR